MHSSWRYRGLAMALLGALLLAALGPQAARAAQPTLRFKRISVEQGLSQNSGYISFQDHYGFMWLGTSEGLNRYDGSGFRIFRNDPDDPTSLPNNTIYDIVEDTQQRLWVATRGGIARFDRDSETFARYQANPDDPRALGHPWVADLQVTRDGTLWAASRGGLLHRYNPADDSFTRFQVHEESGGSNLYEDRQGRLWLNNTLGAQLFDPASGRAARPDFLAAFPAEQSVITMLEDRRGRIWLGGDDGLRVYDPASAQLTHYAHDPSDANSPASNDISQLLEDRNGAIWIGSYDAGVSIFDPSSGLFTQARHDPDNPTSLGGNRVESIEQDRAGLIWVGATRGGFSLYDPATAQFPHYTYDETQPAHLGGRVVMAVAEGRDGTLWVGTEDGGLTEYLPDGGIRNYRHDPNDPTSLSSDAVYWVLEDREGAIWVGTIGAGLNRLDRASGSFTVYRHDPNDPTSLSNDVVVKIHEDRRGQLWVGTEDGLGLFDRDSERFRTYFHDPDDATSISHSEVSYFYEDAVGTLWVATWGGGLNAYDAATDSFRSYTQFPEDPASLADRIHVLAGDQGGGIWMGTPAGAYRFDPGTGAFTNIGEADGLPGARVLCLAEDALGTIWMGSTGGLARVSPGGGVTRVYRTADGLGSNEFVGGACRQLRDGRMIFGGVNGFNIFDPAQLADSGQPPPLALTGVRVFNQPLALGREPAGLEELELSWRDSVFSFEFAALDYADPGRYRYRYRLEGFDEDWIDAGGERLATYTNLEGGNYTFRVQAASGDGIWNEQGIALAVRIVPPPWRTWWAYTLYALGLLGAVAGYVRYRTQAQARELARKQRELDQERLLAERLEEQVAARTAELTAANAERDRFFTLSRDLFCIVGADGTFKRLNDAWEATLGLRPAELLGQPLLDFVHPEDREATAQASRYGERGGRMFSFENRYRCRDGSYRWLSWSYTLAPEHGLFYGVARDITERRQVEEEQRRLAERTAVMDERSRLARELHDSVTQALFSLNLLAASCRFQAESKGLKTAAEDFGRLGEIAQQALREMRLLIYQLRSHLLEREGLIGALQQRLEAVEQRSGVRARLLVEDEVELSPAAEEQIYWIVQEALNNVLKHAAASAVTVRVASNAKGTLVEVADDGRGFDAAAAQSGVGLSSMRERAAQIGAELTIAGGAEGGSVVRIALAEAAEAADPQATVKA
jgi:PAS domain S-box-containing protein